MSAAKGKLQIEFQRPLLLGRDEAASALRISVRKLDQLIERGELLCHADWWPGTSLACRTPAVHRKQISLPGGVNKAAAGDCAFGEIKMSLIPVTPYSHGEPIETDPPFDELHSVADAAKVWGVNKFSVYRWAERGVVEIRDDGQ